MSHFDEELDRRKQRGAEDTARRKSEEDKGLQESMRMAAYELESTQEVRAWAANKLAEIAPSHAETLIERAAVRIKRPLQKERWERQPVERVRGWRVKIHDTYDRDSGNREFRAVYLLTDSRIATGDPSDVQIVRTPEDWYKRRQVLGLEYNWRGKEANEWYRISESDFISAVQRYT